MTDLVRAGDAKRFNTDYIICDFRKLTGEAAAFTMTLPYELEGVYSLKLLSWTLRYPADPVTPLMLMELRGGGNDNIVQTTYADGQVQYAYPIPLTNGTVQQTVLGEDDADQILSNTDGLTSLYQMHFRFRNLPNATLANGSASGQRAGAGAPNAEPSFTDCTMVFAVERTPHQGIVPAGRAIQARLAKRDAMTSQRVGPDHPERRRPNYTGHKKV